MEVHQLRYAVAVARLGNFSRAAAQCHVSQPSLSQQIQKLEEELGARLFDRLRRQAKPTLEGEAFLPRARRILAEIDAARQEAHEAREMLRGKVVVGVLPTIAPYWLPPVIAEFAKRFPGVEIVLEEDRTAQLLKLTGDCEVDLAIVSLPVHDPCMVVENLLTEELLLILPPAHPLAPKRRITLDDLAGERFILMKEGHCLGDQVLDFCTRREFHPQVSCRSAQIETIRSLVRAGLGISLIPRMAAASEAGDTPVCRSLDKPRPSRTLAACWLAQRPPGRAAAEFLKCLRQAAHPAKTAM